MPPTRSVAEAARRDYDDPAGARASGLSRAGRRVRRHGIYSRDGAPLELRHRAAAFHLIEDSLHNAIQWVVFEPNGRLPGRPDQASQTLQP